tara:strand:+ start:1584 stop:1961 length:378 start_codon:yes stop_codon:yes gene_type:complete
MTYQSAIVLFYIGIIFALIYATFKLDDEQHFIIKILLFGMTFFLMLNGVATTQVILDNENTTTSPINETIYSSITNKFETTYTTILWGFILTFLWIGVSLVWKSKDIIKDISFKKTRPIRRKKNG